MKNRLAWTIVAMAVAVCAIAILCAEEGSAAEWVVDENGNGDFLDLPSAMLGPGVSANDTIYVWDGYYDAGTTIIDSSLDNLTIIGNGTGNTEIYVNGVFPNAEYGFAVRANDTRITNLSVYGDNVGTGIRLENVTNTVIENCVFNHSSGTGMNGHGSNYVNISNCSFDGAYGINLGPAWGIAKGVENATFYDCNITGQYDAVLMRYCSNLTMSYSSLYPSDSRTGLEIHDSQYLYIHNNSIYDASEGMRVNTSCDYSLVDHNYVEGRLFGIRFDTNNYCRVGNNTVQGIQPSASLSGVGIRTRLSWENNIYGNNVNGFYQGITMSGTTYNSVVKFNTVNGSWNSIKLEPSSEGHSIYRNSLTNASSTHISNFGVDMVFNMSLPLGGNYYDDAPGSDRGDGFLDTPYTIVGGNGGTDFLPHFLLDAWVPIANGSYVNNITVGSNVTFSSNSSQNADEVLWDFGDGNSTITSNETVNHTYGLPGEYFVRLVVYSDGFSDEDAFVLYVGEVEGGGEEAEEASPFVGVQDLVVSLMFVVIVLLLAKTVVFEIKDSFEGEKKR